MLRFLCYFFPIYIGYFILVVLNSFGKDFNTEQIMFHFLFTANIFKYWKFILDIFTKSILLSYITALILTYFEMILPKKIRYWFKYLPLAILLLDIYYLFNVLKVKNLFYEKDSIDYIEKYYNDPKKLVFDSKKKKNIILIYVESLTMDYRNEELFKENLINELDKIPGHQFKAFNEQPGTGWTVAGLISSQCAVPLKTSYRAYLDMNIDSKMLPNIICISDVLHSLGYVNIFLQGSDSKFASTKSFLLTHHYDQIYGKDELLNQNKAKLEDLHEWGLPDDLLFLNAREILDNLQMSKKNFNFTIFTIDTHSPGGFFSRSCKAQGGKTLADVVKCSSSEVASFVQYVIDKKYIDNTNIVILGDHLPPKNELNQALSKIKNKNIYNKWISKNYQNFNREEITHFDIAPTLLRFIGVSFKGGKFGLGFSAHISDPEPDPSNIRQIFKENLNSYSKFYEEFSTNR